MSMFSRKTKAPPAEIGLPSARSPSSLSRLEILDDDDGVEAEAEFFLVSPSESMAQLAVNKKDTGICVEDGDSDADSVVSEWDGGGWICRPYQRERISAEILKANRKGEKGHAAVLKLLKSSGVRVYIVDSSVSTSVTEIMTSIYSVIHHVSKLDRSRAFFNPRLAKRCILYKDREGRFFNLTLADYTKSEEGAFHGYLSSFSGVQAMCVIVVLCRSFACATEPDIEDFQPAYLGLLLGLVFNEEISFSWIMAAMFVRGLPSISAYSITTSVESDTLRKLLVFVLALGGFTSGRAQLALTLFGISLACAILLANLGARAWGFLHIRPLAIGGPFKSVVGYIAAVLMGIVVPYMGHREIQSGGKSALESVLKSALVVAIVFLASDYDGFQQFLVLGSEKCNQDYVNIVVGGWWALSLIISLILVSRIDPPSVYPDHEEPLLEGDQASPVGFKVPSLPDFPIDPMLAQKGIPCFNFQFEFILGIVMALGIGGGIIALAFTTIDEDFINAATNYSSGVL